MKITPILTASALAHLASSMPLPPPRPPYPANQPAASAIIPREAEVEAANALLDAWKRASPQAPNGYAPATVNCPSTRPSVRPAFSGLSDQEKEWLKKRRPNTLQPMRELLKRINIAGFDAGAYFDKHASNTTALPNVAIAFSGGGYRAMTNGAGALAAFDSRTPNATGSGQIGGLLQSATYIAGLSGGGWLVGSIYTNNFTSVQNIIDKNGDGGIWQFGNSILDGKKSRHRCGALLTADRTQAGRHPDIQPGRLLQRPRRYRQAERGRLGPV